MTVVVSIADIGHSVGWSCSKKPKWYHVAARCILWSDLHKWAVYIRLKTSVIYIRIWLCSACVRTSDMWPWY